MGSESLNMANFRISHDDQLRVEHSVIAPGGTGPRESLPRVRMFRSADLLDVVVSFVGISIDDSGGGRVLHRSDGSEHGYLCAHFGGQHLHEETFFERTEGIAVPNKPPGSTVGAGSTNSPADDPDYSPDDSAMIEPPTPPPVRSRIAARSRVVFTVTDQRIPFTTAGLLAAMRTLPLNVVPHAVDRAGGLIVIDTDALLEPIGGALGIDSLPRISATLQTAGRTLAAAAAVQVRFGDAAAAQVLTAASAAVGSFELSRAAVEAIGARRAVPTVIVDLRPPAPRAPSATETAIEIPFRLQLSPHGDSGFSHATSPAVSSTGRVELWHTRLGIRTPHGVDEGPRADRTVRAVWARDFDELPAFPFREDPPTGDAAGTEFPAAGQQQDRPSWRSPLTSRDRMMLVHESSNFRLFRSGGGRYVPPSVQVHRLMLSTLGGWLQSTFDTTPPRGNTTIEEWTHRAALGRDDFVKVVYAGFMLPFGHRASLVKITQRKVKHGVAHLFQRMFIVVREPIRSYGATGDPTYDRTMPFTTVHITTESTPDLDPPVDLSSGISGLMFTPTIDGQPVRFTISGVDLVGRLVEFDGPLIFAEYDHNANPATVQTTSDAFNAKPPPFDMRGQMVAFAPSAVPDDTSLATAAITFQVGAPAGIFSKRPDQAQTRWEPRLAYGDSVIPAMSVLAGANTTVRVRYPAQYVATQFSGNPAEIFLELVTKAPLNFSTRSDRSGGFVAPSLDVTALSRTLGPVGGATAALFPGSGPPFEIAKFFASSAKLFGLVSLGELVVGGLDTASLPRFQAQGFDPAAVLTTNVERLHDLCARLATQNPGGPAVAQLQGTATAAAATATALAALIPSAGAPPLETRRAAAAAALGALQTQLATVVAAVSTDPSALRADREALAATADRIGDQLGSGAAQLSAVVDQVVRAASGEVLPETMRGRLDWTGELRRWPTADSIFVPDGGGTGRISVAVDVQAPTAPGGEPSALVSCALSPFRLRLIGDKPFVTLHFTTLEFSAAPGMKTDVNVVFDPTDGIEFGGCLEFVETLRSIIPMDGFSDPPYLDVSPAGIRAGFDLPIPNVAMGIFALTNINLSAAFEVPFIGESIAVRFGFSSRESPFRLSIALFAGGGFFGIVITPEEVRELEAALEFGAAVELDFGVASGSVSVMAGIYFRLRTADGTTSALLAGYFRARGEVDVLGLITASIEIYLELSYETASQKAVGRASISVEVSVCLLSFSVSIAVEKKFSGSVGDPTFAQVMGTHPDAAPGVERPWDAYCDAFAN
ncbi:hypothetical protein MJO55_17305 [Mycolicibacterium rufum]|uniref:Tc toxin complex TcA C-terminal TcB-binding domain-containing protein n=2 Tax=Mycolicibacterium rufum TaxID=318424 RepID=A0ABY3UCJ7_9MYCO|nr:hypothetical protein [Mycolicibacterium rufum]ULP35060.1 hypothetical protein MJO55_17305 [Mycolicibacterium rufum]